MYETIWWKMQIQINQHNFSVIFEKSESCQKQIIPLLRVQSRLLRSVARCDILKGIFIDHFRLS